VRIFQRLRVLKPQTRVGLVTLVLIASGVGLLAVSLARFGSVRRDVNELQARVLPARDELVRIDESLSSTTDEFTTMILTTDPAQQLIKLEDTQRQLRVTEERWRRFETISLNLPGEQAYRDRFVASQKEQEDLVGPVGVQLIQGAPTSQILLDGRFRSLRASQQEMSSAVRGLQLDLYNPVVDAKLAEATRSADTGVRDLIVFYLSVMFVSTAIAVTAFRSARANEVGRERDELTRDLNAKRDELEARLNRALEMASTEEAALKLVGHALAEALPGSPTEVLLADSSVAHFRQVLSTDAETRGPGCPVVSPADCPAALRGNTVVFGNSTALDACPFLRERTPTAVAAACQPVSIAGKSIGVIHTVFGPTLPPTDEPFAALELISRRAGERVGMLRAFAESESAAKSDPLTGLLNRRSLDNAVRRISADAAPYAVAYGDLDHFKKLNDTFGHDVGDRALRLFSKALRDAVRPNDLACRYGGEEFVVVLPECPIEEALPVIERVRSAVADIGTSGRVPPFTVSFGLASSQQADSFERVVAMADAALLRAKADGRDRVVVANGAWAQPALPPGRVPALEPGPGV